MGAAFTFRLTNADPVQLVATYRAAALLDPRLRVEVSRQTLTDAPCVTGWGGDLPAGDDQAWTFAQADADTGAVTIETFRDPATGRPRDVALIRTPYSGAVLEALSTGRPAFRHSATFLVIRLSWSSDVAPLLVRIDESTHATGAVISADEAPVRLTSLDGYELRDAGTATAEDYATALQLVRIAGDAARVELVDPTGYAESGDLGLIDAYSAEERKVMAAFRAAYAEIRREEQAHRADHWIADALARDARRRGGPAHS